MKNIPASTMSTIIGVSVLAIAVFILYKSKKTTPTEVTGCDPADPACLGGQLGPHGCVADAGFIWNESLQRCVQPWLINM